MGRWEGAGTKWGTARGWELLGAKKAHTAECMRRPLLRVVLVASIVNGYIASAGGSVRVHFAIASTVSLILDLQ